mmetsp:Transcript_5444/g.11948  ORF Transcript_5444/g.11948 Transcript_5444/m.11948 type:complete len:215 (-) Transcript_5444:208-852(-)
MQTCLDTTGGSLHASPTYPVSSRSSRRAACSGVSSSSINPAGNSSVDLPIGGRNCSTRSVSRVKSSISSTIVSLLSSFAIFVPSHAYGRFRMGMITTASVEDLDFLVVRVAQSHLRSFPSMSVYDRVSSLSHLVLPTVSDPSMRGRAVPGGLLAAALFPSSGVPLPLLLLLLFSVDILGLALEAEKNPARPPALRFGTTKFVFVFAFAFAFALQ